jgi:hypothetical protein
LRGIYENEKQYVPFPLFLFGNNVIAFDNNLNGGSDNLPGMLLQSESV